VPVEDIDRGWVDILSSVERANGKSTKVGVVGEAARRKEPSGLTVANVAAIQEFGSGDGHVPERSFIRDTVDKHQDELFEELERIAGDVYDGKSVDSKQELAQLGAFGAELIADAIREGLEPDLADSTIEQKREHGDSEVRPLAGWLAESQGHEEQDHDDGEGEGDG
jgi:hypothetical protein